MAYRLQLRLDAATTCAAEVIKGTVVVDVSASTGQGRLPDRPVAVRVLVYGDESHSDGISVEHLKLLSTVAGDRAANEEAQTAALLCDAAAFHTDQTRANPLPGVPMDTHYGRGYYGDDAGVRRQQQHQPEPDGYLQPSDLAAAPQQASRPPSPPAAHTTAPTPATADSQHAPLAPPPQSWVPGGHYEYPFALQLPPWLPPSYYYEPRDNEADARLRYVVCAFVATAASGKATTADPGSTRVLVTKAADDKASASRRRSSVGSSSKGSEAPESPLKGKKGSAAVAATTAATEVAAATTTKLSLPTQAKQLLRVLAREQVKELVVLSVFPQREFLQCLERVAIKPRFAHRLVFHVYKNTLTLSGFAKAPVTDINVRVSYDSSAAVVLCGRPQAMERVRAVLGVQGGGAPVGLTVTGTVVSPGGGTGAVVQGGLTAQQTHGALDGMLRLRVKVTAGSVSVGKVRVELCQRVRFAGSSSAQQCDTYTLASYTHKAKIRAEETATFEARLELPKAFRHSRQDNNKLLPPAGITTAGIRTSTWLQVTFPDLDAVPEKVMEENVVMMAEGVDFSDTVPFLPHVYRAAPRAPTSRSRKVV